MIKTCEEARLLIQELQICTIFESQKSGLPSLWAHVDLPEKQAGEKGWGQKVSAIWDWKKWQYKSGKGRKSNGSL